MNMMMMMRRRRREGREEEESVAPAPAWLQGLMAETFFAACGVHENHRKNEKNIFCLNCCHSLCPHCLSSHSHSHSHHPLLQVRRYVYQDVIRLEDLEKLIDCSYIQPYTINSAKVIFLNQRSQSRSSSSCNNKATSANSCFTCERMLQDPFNFCSLSCKVVYQGQDLSAILYRFDESHLTISQFEGLRVDGSGSGSDDGQITPNSILEDPHEYGGSNYGTGHATIRNSSKNKGGFIMLSNWSSRRKGAPQRSPLS